MGGLFQLFWGRGGDFQELGHRPLFGLLWSGLSWCPWVCHLAYANALQSLYNEAQGLLEVEASTILGFIGSNQFLLCPQQLCHSFKCCAFMPSPSQYHSGVLSVAQHKFKCPMHSKAEQTETLEFGAEKGLLQGHARRQVAHVQKPQTPGWFSWRSFYR